MGRIAYGFPIFYNGLVGRQTLKSQPAVLNILFNGGDDEDAILSQDWIDRPTANKYANGGEPVPRHIRDAVLSLPRGEVARRMGMLRIGDARKSVSAFHAYLCGNTDISRYEAEALEESVRQSADPCQYMAEALLIALRRTGPSSRIGDGLKNTLRTLHKSDVDAGLFPMASSPAGSGLPAMPSTAGAAVWEASRALLAALFPGGGAGGAAPGLLREGEFGKALEALSSSGNIPYLELYRCRNFLQAVQEAVKILEDAGEDAGSGGWGSGKGFGFDWFLRFFEAAGNITDEDMRALWARVLAGEAGSPGSFSLRTVETLRNMTAGEALAFKNMCGILLTEMDGTRFIFYAEGLRDFRLNERHGASPGDIYLMEECGLLSAMRTENIMESQDDVLSGFYDQGGVLLRFQGGGEEGGFRYRSYPLTGAALQLLPVIYEPDDTDRGYILDLGRVLRKEYGGFGITAHRILSFDGEDMEIDGEDLLGGA